MVKQIFILLLFFCLIGCGEEEEIAGSGDKVCLYCSTEMKDYMMSKHITVLLVDNKLIETCWGEIRRAAREGIKNDTIHYKK